MRFEEATARLVTLARANGGVLTAQQVEADPALAADRETVSAAARALQSHVDVITLAEGNGPEWFPFSGLVFHGLGAGRDD
jgi:hypothetical protein